MNKIKGRYHEFIKNNDNTFAPPEFNFELMAQVQKEISEKEYFNFILEVGNGGLFFNNALHIYGFCYDPEFHSIDAINKIISKEFEGIADGLYSFGQDIFGNQFMFALETREIVFFNIETGERKVIASDFEGFIKTLMNDLEYYTGSDFLKSYFKEGVKFDERICPKKPFVIGGAYEKANLYVSPFPDYIKNNANITRQIYNLPEGTKIEIKIIK